VEGLEEGAEGGKRLRVPVVEGTMSAAYSEVTACCRSKGNAPQVAAMVAKLYR
jgi:hypothetical protein